MSMKAALISGGNGWIAQKLSTRLKKEGWRVALLSREVLYKPEQLKKTLEVHKPDVIFATHAYGNMYHQTEANKIIAANIVATHNLLEASKDIPFKHFVYLSTSSVYGKSSTKMYEEDRVFPESMYAITKHTAENLCLMYKKKYNKSFIIPRLFSVYGPGEAEFRFIPTICRSIIKSEEINVDENPEHSWIYIDDVIDALLALIDNQKFNESIVNVCTKNRKTNKEIVKMVLRATGNSDILYTPINNLRTDHSHRWFGDNTYLHNLGWSQKTTLEEGLQKTFKYYEKLYRKTGK